MKARLVILALLALALVGCTRTVIVTATPVPNLAPPTSKDVDLSYPTGDVSPIWITVKLTILAADGVTPAVEQQVGAVIRDVIAKSTAKAIIGLKDGALDDTGKVRIQVREIVVPQDVRFGWQLQAGEAYFTEARGEITRKQLRLDVEAEATRAAILQNVDPRYFEYLRAKGNATTAVLIAPEQTPPVTPTPVPPPRP